MRQRLVTTTILAFIALAGCKHTETPPLPPTPEPTAAPAPETPKAAAVAPAVAPAPTGKPMLWKLTRGADHIYLFGTIHTGGESFVPKVAWDALDGSKVFVMEANVSGIDQGELMKRMLLPAGQSLDKMISPAAWTTLVANKPALLPEAQLKRSKPWFAAMTVLQSWLSGGEAVDLALKARAEQQKLTIDYFETWQQQLDMVEVALDARSLEVFLQDLPGGKKSLDDLVAAYRAGDVDQIIKLTADDPTMTAAAREIMLTRRNKAWVPKLIALAKQGDAFVAVGAGHVVGKDGLIDLLGKEGFKAERAE